jgi:acyl-CoA thioester hydrolase
VSSADLIPTFSTAVNTWQCDENAHLNVQFYTEFGHEASSHLLHRLGLGPRAQAALGATIEAKEDHIRYLREFRIVDTVEIRSAPVAVGERSLTLYHEVRNPADGTLASTIRRQLECDQPWPPAFRLHAERSCIDLPSGAQPRSVGQMPLPALKFEDCTDTGLIDVSRTLIKPHECDEQGRFLPRHLFGRYSDAASWLWNHMGFDRRAMQERGEGPVLVETLHSYRTALPAGALLVIRSGLASYTDKILKLYHFAFDAESGALAAGAEVIGMKFDQKQRKIMTFSAEDQARLAACKLRL